MTPVVKFKMTGQRELLDKFHRLDRKIKRTVATKALRAGAKIMVAALRQASPKPRGPAAKSIGTKIKTYRSSGITVAICGERVGFTSKAKKLVGTAPSKPLLHLIEYGTVERFRTGAKKGTGAAAIYGKRAVREAALMFRIQQVGFENVSASAAKAYKRVKLQSRLLASVILATAKKLGGRTGRVAAKPFFEKAFRSTVGRMQAAQVAVLRREIEALARTG